VLIVWVDASGILTRQHPHGKWEEAGINVELRKNDKLGDTSKTAARPKIGRPLRKRGNSVS
jgi:hypothetical protein